MALTDTHTQRPEHPPGCIICALSLLTVPVARRAPCGAVQVGACAELLTCIVANIWDFEKLGVPSSSADGHPDSSAVRVAGAAIPCKIDVNDALRTMIEMLKSSPLYKSGVLLRAICDDMIPQCLWGHRTVFMRGLLNLVSNALKFTDKGHVTVHTSLLSAPENETLRVRIDVVDTGRGMSEEAALAARQPYVKGELDARVSGLGLGLPIVISTIESVGGRFNMDSSIDVRARPARGSPLSSHTVAKGPPPRSTAVYTR